MTGNHRPPAVIHVDLDGAREIFQTHGWDYPFDDDVIFETGMERILAFFDENAVRATLFVIAQTVHDPRKRPILNEAVKRGHEIASHTVSHRNLLKIDTDQKRYELGESRTLLERELGTPVTGFRAPGYQIDRESMEILVDSGYSWDSSAFATDLFATRLKTSVPSLTTAGRPYHGLDLVELPLPDHRPSPVPVNPSYALLFGVPYFRWGINRQARLGRPLTLLFHLIDVADPLPAGRLRGFRSRIFTLSNLSAASKRIRCQRMLDHLRSRYDVTSTENLVGSIRGA